MSVRLTNTMRENLADKIVGYAYDAKQAEAEASVGAAGHALYEIVYPKTTREAMKKLPSGAFACCRWFGVAFGAMGYRRIETATEVPVFFSDPRLDPTDGIIAMAVSNYDAAIEAKKTLKAARTDHRKQVVSALSRLRTVDQIREQWPEVSAFLAGMNLSLPVVRVAELNAALGLPPDTVAA